MALIKMIKNEFDNCTTRIIGSPYVPISINYTTIKKGCDIKGMPKGYWKDDTHSIAIYGFRLGRIVIAFMVQQRGDIND